MEFGLARVGEVGWDHGKVLHTPPPEDEFGMCESTGDKDGGVELSVFHEDIFFTCS